MRPFRRLIVPILITFLPLIPQARAQHAAQWEIALADQPLVIEKARALADALERGDLAALSAQFPKGKLRLLAGRAGAPAQLRAHSQALALIGAYLRLRPGLKLDSDFARYEREAGLAHVAFAYRYQEASRDRPRRDRIVAVYSVGEDGVHLVELRCP